MATHLSSVPYPVVISASDNDSLNETRRQAVVQELAAAGYRDADQRVIIERPEGEGLYGPEAARIGVGRLLGTTGTTGGAGGGTGGGIGGAGAGAAVEILAGWRWNGIY